MSRKDPVPLSVDLERYIASLNIPEVSLLVSLRKAWTSIVGPLLADKTFPARFRNGRLLIMVCNHAWAQELQMSKSALLSKITSAAGPHSPVLDLRFVVGTIPPPEEDQTGTPEIIPTRPAMEPKGLSEVTDPEIRESLRAIIREMRIPEKD